MFSRQHSRNAPFEARVATILAIHPADVFHITPASDLGHRLKTATSSNPPELVSTADVTNAAENRLRQLPPEGAELWCKPEFIVAHGDVPEMILGIAKRRESDLTVLGVRPESGVPGACRHLPIATSHKVVSHAPCPVLPIRHSESKNRSRGRLHLSCAGPVVVRSAGRDPSWRRRLL